MEVVLVLSGTPSHALTGNIVLDGLFGARIVWAGDVTEAGLDAVVKEVAEDLHGQGPGLR
jgi:D-cysteine desulfhydrase